jgi:phospholipase C
VNFTDKVDRSAAIDGYQSDDYYGDLDGRNAVNKPKTIDSDDDFDQQVKEMVQQDPDFDEDTMNRVMAMDEPNGSTRGCVAYALYGNCYKGKDCKYFQGHNEAVAKDSRKWMVKKLAQMMHKDAGIPRKLLVRDDG